MTAREKMRRFFSNPNSLGYRVSVAGLAVLIIWMASAFWRGAALLDNGTAAPGWSLPRVDRRGEKLDLEGLKGQVVVLDFWGISCPPCLRQIGILEEVLRQMGPRGVAVVGVAVQEEPIEEIREFVRQRSPSYPIVVDNGPVTRAYKVSNLPTLYVLDRNGVVVSSHRGLMDTQSLSRAVGRVLVP